MSVSMIKVSDFAVGSDVIDFAWDDKGERGTITDGPKHFDPRWEITWELGIRTYETFDDMIRYERVPAARKGVSLGKPSDIRAGYSVFPWLYTRQWRNTVKLYTYLTNGYGNVTGGNLYDTLADNNLEGLRNTLQRTTRH